MRRFPWRFAVYFAAALYLFADLALWRGPLHRRLTRPWDEMGADGAGTQAAMVYGRPVTRLELSEAMRSHLWLRGEEWTALSAGARQLTRQLVLEQLVNDRMVRAFRVMNRLDQPVPADAVEKEVELQRRQFANADDWSRRLELQARTEKEFVEETREALEDAAWIEEKIQHRLLEVNEVLARDWYDRHKDELTVPERFRASHLFLSAHDPAKPDRSAEVTAITTRLASGETFESLVKELSEDARSNRRGGDLGWFSSERMPEDFMSAIRAAPLGEIKGPVRTRLGWHWIRTGEHQAERLPSYEEAQSEILAHLQHERRSLATKALLAELRQRSIQPTRFLHYFSEVIDATEPAKS